MKTRIQRWLAQPAYNRGQALSLAATWLAVGIIGYLAHWGVPRIAGLGILVAGLPGFVCGLIDGFRQAFTAAYQRARRR